MATKTWWGHELALAALSLLSLPTNKSFPHFFSHQRADMAMADLTINYQREMVVDFTMPFLELGKSNIKVQIF